MQHDQAAFHLAAIWVSKCHRRRREHRAAASAVSASLQPLDRLHLTGRRLWIEMQQLDELRPQGKPIASGAAEGGSDPATSLDRQVASDEWDAIVGSRMLYRLIGCALATR